MPLELHCTHWSEERQSVSQNRAGGPECAANAHRLRRAALLERFGSGLITGATDADPSGIATYSQAGAQLRAKMRRRGMGVAQNMRRLFPSRAGQLEPRPFRDLSATVKRAVLSRLVDKFSPANASRCSTSEKHDEASGHRLHFYQETVLKLCRIIWRPSAAWVTPSTTAKT
ncbi:hypothetical protein CN111_02920 [Sinorhizobium meliloti]|nr:hypothetical protein CN111_02920 [Sinorhizobium meliloti]